jgi:hypothetical protein
MNLTMLLDLLLPIALHRLNTVVAHTDKLSDAEKEFVALAEPLLLNVATQHLGAQIGTGQTVASVTVPLGEGEPTQ